MTINSLELDQTSHKMYLCASGGGAGLQSLLWEVPGVSKVLLGAEFPYATRAMDQFLGFKPERYCSADTSIDLAIESLQRAKNLGTEGDAKSLFTIPCLGLGLTATLATSREHKGDHRVHVAVLGDNLPPVVRTLVIPKGRYTRQGEGEIADRFGHNCLLEFLGQSLEVQGEAHPDSLVLDTWFKRPFWSNFGGEAPNLMRMTTDTYWRGRTFYPGSFNPTHEGHLLMGDNATWMIDAGHPDKGQLSVPEMLTRVMTAGREVLFTRNLGWFVDKFKAFPECHWIMGTDTLDRVLNSPHGPKADEVIRTILETQSRIQVHSRPGSPTLDDLGVQHNLPGYPTFIEHKHPKREQKTLSLSSTKIREEWGLP